MIPLPDRGELRRRVPRLLLGLVIFALGIALLVRGELGLGPWDVLHQGLADRTGVGIGTITIVVGVALLALWVPLRQRLGLGTVLNAILIGVVVDLALALIPEVDSAVAHWVLMPAGVLGMAVGSGFYIGAGLGPGPRDGLMTGIAARTGWSVRSVRTGIEVTVLVVGFVLGGTVGIGTVVQALAIGPLVQLFLERLSLPPLVRAT